MYRDDHDFKDGLSLFLILTLDRTGRRAGGYVDIRLDLGMHPKVSQAERRRQLMFESGVR